MWQGVFPTTPVAIDPSTRLVRRHRLLDNTLQRQIRTIQDLLGRASLQASMI